jgi:hypothetical protein
MLNRLTNIDYPNLALVPQEVVLTKVCMNQLRSLVKATDQQQGLIVDRPPVIDVGITKTRSRDAVLTKEVHDDDIVL